MTILRAIIFDFDGVIADTEPLHFRAFERVLARTPWQISEEEYFSRYLGLTDKVMLERLTVDRATPFAAGKLSALLQRKYDTYLAMIADGIEPTPGLREFLATIPPQIPLAICSGARRKEIELLLRHIGISGRFVTIVSSEDVPTSKPDPDGYLLTLGRLQSVLPNLSARSVLAIEDSALGLRAAHDAGLRTMAIKPGHSKVDVSLAESLRPDFGNLTFEYLDGLYK
jgi:beta-phosphoglucomutase